MRIEHHAVAGTALAIVAWIADSPTAAVTVLAGSVLIDLDHYAWYVIRFRDLSLQRAGCFYSTRQADQHYCLCICHTVEVIAVYLACLWTRGPLFWFAVGALGHILLDITQSALDGGLLRRRWSLLHGIAYGLRLCRTPAGPDRSPPAP